MAVPSLTTTSYAVLGQLTLRPWSMYEMTKNIRRTYHWFWPRAESQIYAEAKRLVELGLATSRQLSSNGRRRTVYTITDRGREALLVWLATPTDHFTLHFEPLLRVHLALNGSREDLLRSVGEAREVAEEMLRQAMQIGTEFVEERHQFQNQVHIRALIFDFLWGFALTMYLWADRTIREVEGWNDLELGDKGPRAVALIRRALEEAPIVPISLTDGGAC